MINADRLFARFEAMAAIGALPTGGITRLALSAEDIAARQLLAQWIYEIGLQYSVDMMGNMYARRMGTDASATPVMLGSHLDSVPNGGCYDGTLGVLCALEVLHSLHDGQVTTRRPVELINFTNEEGARFQPAMLASGVLSQTFSLEEAYRQYDQSGERFEAALKKSGYLGDRPCQPFPFAGYLELHIEQGPVLEHAGIPIGIVRGIVGIAWLRIIIEGVSNHAGPTPMAGRRDALVAASELIARIRGLPEQLEHPDLRTTVGRMHVTPNIINAIPGRVELYADFRAPYRDVITQAMEATRHILGEIAEREGVRWKADEMWSVPPTPFDNCLVQLMTDICRQRGVPFLHMESGAGHDAQYMAKIGPTAMIFVPSCDGRSHCPAERSEREPILRGCQLLYEATLALAEVVA